MKRVEWISVPVSVAEVSYEMDATTKAKIQALEDEIASLKRSASEEANKKPAVVTVGGSLPPPSTYAEAVRREFNRARHAEARADKLNRAKMSAVSQAAAELRQKEKELALREKFKEGYIPLEERRKASRPKKASEAKITVNKPKTLVEKAAVAAHGFVRFTRAQMKEHQMAVLNATGADKWFSAAERAAYKALDPGSKAKIKAARNLAREKREAAKAAERQKFREERAVRVAALTKARVEALAKSTPKQRYSGNANLFVRKGKEPMHCTTGHRMVTNVAGTAISCRDCGFVPRAE
jgi:hypothetical protein